MGGPNKKRPSVRATIPRGSGGGVAVLPDNDTCEKPITFDIKATNGRLAALSAGQSVQVLGGPNGSLILASGEYALGRMPAFVQSAVRGCITRGFDFSGVVNQVNTEESVIRITIAGTRRAAE